MIASQQEKIVENTIEGMKTLGTMSLCVICNIRPQEQLHHIDFNHKNNDPTNHQLICTLCHAKIHNIEPRICALKRLVLLHNITQKARCAIDNQIRGYSRIEIIVPDFMNDLSKSLVKKEKEYEKQIKNILEGNHLSNENQHQIVPSSSKSDDHLKLETHPINVYPTYSYLKSIKGISHLLAGKLLSYVDINKSPTVASLWAYAGQTPDSKKMKGKKSNWNQELKMICFQIGDSFVKQRTPKYREIYDNEKAKQLKLLETIEVVKTIKKESQESKSETNLQCSENHTQLVGSVPKSKMHCHRRAMRKAVKEFLKDYWVHAKEVEIKKEGENATTNLA